jgi:hypothetical protein
MCRRNLLRAMWIAMAWSGLAAAQTMSAGPAARGPNATAANPATNVAHPTARNRTRVSNAVPSSNQRDCSQLRGIEKSECERRDTVRDDLPAGVTSTQKATARQPEPQR